MRSFSGLDIWRRCIALPARSATRRSNGCSPMWPTSPTRRLFPTWMGRLRCLTDRALAPIPRTSCSAASESEVGLQLTRLCRLGAFGDADQPAQHGGGALEPFGRLLPIVEHDEPLVRTYPHGRRLLG